jgi:hypothetical protein
MIGLEISHDIGFTRLGREAPVTDDWECQIDTERLHLRLFHPSALLEYHLGDVAG